MCQLLCEIDNGETVWKALGRKVVLENNIERGSWKNSEESAIAAQISGKLRYLMVKHLVKYGNLEYRKYTNLTFIL